MNFADVLAQDWRLVILRLLTEAPGMVANESVLKQGLAAVTTPASRDQMRAQIAWLAEQNLVRTELLHPQSGDLVMVHLLVAGEEVANGRYHPGVARRGAE